MLKFTKPVLQIRHPGFSPIILVLVIALTGSLVAGSVAIGIHYNILNYQPTFDLQQELGQTTSLLDPEKILSSTFAPSILGLVPLPDGSFSSYQVVDAMVTPPAGSPVFIAGAKLIFPSGDYFSDSLEAKSFTRFVLKDGSESAARVIEPIIVRLIFPNGQALPIRLLEGQVLSGNLTGQFTAQTFTTGYLIAGEIDPRGRITTATISSGAAKLPEAQSIIAHQALSYYNKLYKETSTKVLGFSSSEALTEITDEDNLDGGPIPIFNSSKGTWTFGGDVVSPSL